MDPTYFFSTSAQTKSLLDFPPSVRNRIYAYAIYDYDCGAVFLPRAVPRKVTAEMDEDMEEHFEGDGEVLDGEGAVRHFEWPENVEGCCAAGRWVIGDEDQEGEHENDGDSKSEREGEGNDAAGQEEDSFDGLSDEENMSVTDNTEPETPPMSDSVPKDMVDLGNEDELDVVTGQVYDASDFDLNTDLTTAEEEHAPYDAQDHAEAKMEQLSTQEICQEFNLDCRCPCHKDEETTSSSAASDSDQDEDHSEQDYADDEKAAASFDQEDSKSDKDDQAISENKQETDADIKDDNDLTSRNNCPNSSNDRQCDCPCHPEHIYWTVSDQEIATASSESSIPTLPSECRNGECEGNICDDCDPNEPASQAEDFVELRDLDEQIGMLYNRREPPILRASKQIREECLEVYYGTNSFSWRFLMLDYARSLRRYVTWTDRLRNEDAMLIKNLTFEGRHAQECGVEFVVDVDLLDNHPFFTCTVQVSHEPDVPLDAINRALKNELVQKLSRLSGRGCRQIKFTPDSLAKLGEIFVQYMEW